MSWVIISVIVIALLFAGFFVFQNELSVFFVNLTKTKSVSFWASVSDQPVWMLSQLRFVGLPPECIQEGYNGYHDPQTFSDTGYCADIVCSNGELKITGTNSSECVNPSTTKCNFGILDNSTGLCVMNSCQIDSDCDYLFPKLSPCAPDSNCIVHTPLCIPTCKEFGKGIFIPATNQKASAVKVCSCQ